MLAAIKQTPTVEEAHAMDRTDFWRHYEDWQRGKISRRRFMQVTGLGMASAIIAACAPSTGASPAASAAPSAAAAPTAAPSEAAAPSVAATMDPMADWTPPEGVDLGKELLITTWPNYHDPKTIQHFTDLTGVAVEINPLGSNEEMLAKLLIGNTGWDVLVPTNYTFETYGSKKLVEALELAKLPHLDTTRYDQNLLKSGYYPAGSGVLWGFNKDWGTTGYTINTKYVKKPMTTWKDFFDLAQSDYSGKVTIHDYQLTSIGNALVYNGFSFNSVDAAELAKAEELLIAAKPHLFAITSDYQPPMRAEDAWVAMTWTNDAAQLHRDIPTIEYVIGADGGEIWSDFFAVVTGTAHRDAAYAFLDFMATPKVGAKDAEFHGAPVVDSAMIELLPRSVTSNKITYPDAAALTKLEFGTAELLTNEARAELWARFKSA
jgi:spermidine/putrescine transport system substrate-binding protein